MGALKSNIGHLETAAGIAGLIKVVLSLKHKQIPPNLHFEKLNPQLDLTNTNIKLANEVIDLSDKEVEELWD